MIFEGFVLGGLQQARQLGYPTANIDIEIDLEPGVYASWVTIEGQRYGAALMVGGDFGQEKSSKVEVHLIDLPDRDLYGMLIRVESLQKVSDMISVCGTDELLDKIRADIARIREILTL